jgi:hypothetical protein
MDYVDKITEAVRGINYLRVTSESKGYRIDKDQIRGKSKADLVVTNRVQKEQRM